MFMAGCPEELDEKLRRMQCRDLVMRNLLGLASGMQKMHYWDLWHDVSNRGDLMHLMYAKLRLMAYENGKLTRRYPAAETFERMARALDGVTTVRRVAVPGDESMFLFEVDRGERGPVWVVWQRRDAFSGEDEPPVPFSMDWEAGGATAIDALGRTVPVAVGDGEAGLQVSLTPIFIEPTD
jgi:hypothetical protein